MRRGALAVIGTVAGTALLVGAKLGTPAPADPNAAALDAAGGGPSGDAGSGPPGPAGAPGSASGGSAPDAGPSARSGAPTPGGTAKPGPAPPPTTPAAGGGLKNGNFTGAGAAAKNYEVVTVTITVSSGKITVATGSCGNASGESRSICQGALPKLQQEALSAQNARIATVSGATYTSNAYRSSLQSALDQTKA
jgi:uncharacterized protein with FMN-binding domain